MKIVSSATEYGQDTRPDMRQESGIIIERESTLLDPNGTAYARLFVRGDYSSFYPQLRYPTLERYFLLGRQRHWAKVQQSYLRPSASEGDPKRPRS